MRRYPKNLLNVDYNPKNTAVKSDVERQMQILNVSVLQKTSEVADGVQDVKVRQKEIRRELVGEINDMKTILEKSDAQVAELFKKMGVDKIEIDPEEVREIVANPVSVSCFSCFSCYDSNE